MIKPIDDAILLVYYISSRGLSPRMFPPAMTLRHAGKLVEKFLDSDRTGSAVYQRISDFLIPGGYMERTGEFTTCPYYVTEKGVQYVIKNYSSFLHSIGEGGG
jgi:hypothetical protein